MHYDFPTSSLVCLCIAEKWFTCDSLHTSSIPPRGSAKAHVTTWIPTFPTGTCTERCVTKCCVVQTYWSWESLWHRQVVIITNKRGGACHWATGMFLNRYSTVSAMFRGQAAGPFMDSCYWKELRDLQWFHIAGRGGMHVSQSLGLCLSAVGDSV